MTDRPPLFDQTLRDQRRRRALRRPGEGADFLLEAAGEDLAERLGAVERRFATAADLGSASPALAARLLATGRVGRVVRVDRLAETGPDIVGDESDLPFDEGSLDLVTSALALQWCDDLPGALAAIRRVLKPDGLFLAVLLGGDTLIELREALTVAEIEATGGAGPRVIPFARLADVGALVQRAGFALPVVDREKLTVRYRSVEGLIADLRAMGATNPLHERSRRPLTRAVRERLADIYAERFADPDGRLRATFDMIAISGWVPHESQQKPLRPGSATARLADALGTREIPAGDKAGG